IGKYAFLPGTLGLERDVLDLLRQPDGAHLAPQVNAYLEQLNERAGTLSIYVIDAKGHVMATSNWRRADSFMGEDLSFRPYFRDAMATGSGRFFGIGTTRGEPGYYLASTLVDDSRTLGVAVIKVSLDQLEKTWSTVEAPAMVSDENGAVILGSVADWKFTTLRPLDDATRSAFDQTLQYNRRALKPLGLQEIAELDHGARLVRIARASPEPVSVYPVAGRFLAQSRPLPGTPWTLTVLSHLEQVDDMVQSRTALAVVGAAFIFMLGMMFDERRRHLKAKLAARAALQKAHDELERKVEERTAELVAASAAKSQFLAHMSHEIRTPMNAVLGLTQLLAQEPLAPGQAAMVRHIGEAGDSLLRIINDILDLSKIEAGQIHLENLPFTLSRLLHHVDSLLRPSAIRQGLTLAVTVPAGQSDRFLGDQTRLEQVLINLVGNAIKFTAEGSVELAATLLEECGQRARFRFSVRDTGIGLSPEAQVRLFQPFSQGDASITRRFGGTGLGLSISKRLVELMGGEMGLDSEEGRGSTFWFELTLTQAGKAEAETPATVPAGSTPEGSALAGLRILAVDDNRINLMVLEKALKKEAAKVTLAGDGQQALQVLQTQAQAFDLVLMDVQMPVMDGLTATREIRRNPELRDLPVIALTAGVLPEERQAALDAGMNGFLAKPLDLRQMRDLLSRYRPGNEQDNTGNGLAKPGQEEP
ncbi:MAG: ATP-binding protein, partial [Methylococcus sp.]